MRPAPTPMRNKYRGAKPGGPGWFDTKSSNTSVPGRMVAAIASPTTVVAVAALLGALLLVPRHEFRRLSPFGLVGGFFTAVLVLAIGGPILRLWSFHDRLRIAGIPVMLAMAWYPAEIIFAYFFKLLPRWGQRLALILGTALGAAITYNYLERAGVWRNLQPFDGTRLFTLSAFIHALLAAYLHLKSKPKNRLSSIPPLY